MRAPRLQNGRTLCPLGTGHVFQCAHQRRNKRTITAHGIAQIYDDGASRCSSIPQEVGEFCSRALPVIETKFVNLEDGDTINARRRNQPAIECTPGIR